MVRLINEKIKKPLAQEVLFDKLMNGGIVEVDEQEGDIFLKITPKKSVNKITNTDLVN